MSAALEGRYRRLLALYPADYRAAYEDEMLGVLLAGSTPDRRFPALGETMSLVWSAGWRRLRQPRSGTPDTWWGDALAAVGVLAAMLMLGRQLRPFSMSGGWAIMVGHPLPALPAIHWLRVAFWAAIVVAVLFRSRRLAAAGAWAAALGELVSLVVRQAPPDLPPLALAWPVGLTAIVAVALSVPGGARRGVATLRRRGVALCAAAGALLAFAPLVVPALTTVGVVTVIQSGEFVGLDERWFRAEAASSGTLVLALTVWMAAILPPPVRRRALALCAPAVTLWAAAQVGSDRPFGGILPTALLWGPGHWVLLVVGPLLVLATSVFLVYRSERVAPRPTA
ncbi:hypothetical protein AB0M43_03835 [Longispora sp. NPDC051575]|uniref:hypothetical protein n=1 Tax=Longispora sp. NPDC051575 TaxID=3154943 RepID=UPI00341EAB53